MQPPPIVRKTDVAKHRTSGGEGFLKVSTYFHDSKLLWGQKNTGLNFA
jgi:hypothetical protein